MCRRHAGTRARRGRRALRMARINAAAWAPSLAGGRRAWRCPTCSRDSSERSGRSARSGKLPQSRRSGRACAGTQSIPACEEPESGADAARGSQHTAPSCRDTAAPPALITCASLERLLSWDLANFWVTRGVVAACGVVGVGRWRHLDTHLCKGCKGVCAEPPFPVERTSQNLTCHFAPHGRDPRARAAAARRRRPRQTAGPPARPGSIPNGILRVQTIIRGRNSSALTGVGRCGAYGPRIRASIRAPYRIGGLRSFTGPVRRSIRAPYGRYCPYGARTSLRAPYTG